MSGFKNPITIKESIDSISQRNFLLPAIQRKFVWKSHQIEVLFDSIMRGYPINSFMFWKVSSDEIKNNFRFYEFIKEYRQKFKEDNPYYKTVGFDDFIAVIDGQQRLTSLYIGLTGSYAYKSPRVWWKDNQECLPTRHLYLNLAQPKSTSDELQMFYDFRFLTSTEYENANEQDQWFLVNDVLKISEEEEMDEYIDENGLNKSKFSKDSFRKLWRSVHQYKLINYYEEVSQEIDTVLDIFIRTNSGGEPLTFTDLLMSITTAQWTKLDARKELSNTVKEIFRITSPAFIVTQDLILKTCLVLLNDDIKFRVQNFDYETVLNFENNWKRVKKCIIESFTMLSNMGFTNSTLRAKNAIIPIAYFIFHKEIESEINSPIKHKESKEQMRKWLSTVLLKGQFGGTPDNVIRTTRKVLREHLGSSNIFPFNAIKDAFKSNPNKNLSFDEDYLNSLVTTQIDSPESFMILTLLYPHINYQSQTFHMDHMHPQSHFLALKESDFESNSEYEFYTNKENWNSILNLQLLNGTVNESKNAGRLEDWVSTNKIDRMTYLIPQGISLSEDNFREFISQRKEMILSRFQELKDMVHSES